MSVQTIKGWVLVGLSGLVILLCVVLVGLQWGNSAQFSFYGQNKQVNTLLLMAGCVLGGMVLWGMLRVLAKGIGALRRPPASPPPAQTPAPKPKAQLP